MDSDGRSGEIEGVLSDEREKNSKVVSYFLLVLNILYSSFKLTTGYVVLLAHHLEPTAPRNKKKGQARNRAQAKENTRP